MLTLKKEGLVFCCYLFFVKLLYLHFLPLAYAYPLQGEGKERGTGPYFYLGS